MTVTADLIDAAIDALERRADEIADALQALNDDVPGDPGLFRWPPYLEREFERLSLELEENGMQRRTLARVRAQS